MKNKAGGLKIKINTPTIKISKPGVKIKKPNIKIKINPVKPNYALPGETPNRRYI